MTLKIVLKKPGEKPSVETFEVLDIAAMKKLVGGDLELLKLTDGICLWMMKGADPRSPNFWVGPEIIAGDAFFSSHTVIVPEGDVRKADISGLSEQQIKQVFRFFEV